MIFSFSDKSFEKINFSTINTDVFCFFHSVNAVKVPENFWFHAITSSLKLKKDVLILEHNMTVFPSINTTQRWQVGDGFLWLAPRSLSVLFEATNVKQDSYIAIKAFLNHRK